MEAGDHGDARDVPECVVASPSSSPRAPRDESSNTFPFIVVRSFVRSFVADDLCSVLRPLPRAVIDVHQSWTGPCKAIQSTFKKIFFEHGDKPIKFFTADASKIDAAKDYVGSCEPVFLFYKDGKKKEVRGVDAPTIVKMIYDGLGVDPNAAGGGVSGGGRRRRRRTSAASGP